MASTKGKKGGSPGSRHALQRGTAVYWKESVHGAPSLPAVEAVMVIRQKYPDALVSTRRTTLLATRRESYLRANLSEQQRLAYFCAECRCEQRKLNGVLPGIAWVPPDIAIERPRVPGPGMRGAVRGGWRRPRPVPTRENERSDSRSPRRRRRSWRQSTHEHQTKRGLGRRNQITRCGVNPHETRKRPKR